MRRKPAAYGVQAAARGQPLSDAQLDTLLRDKLVLQNVKTLAQHGLVRLGVPKEASSRGTVA